MHLSQRAEQKGLEKHMFVQYIKRCTCRNKNH
nr:MAG TPA: hypothetical protein [Crassvirales sp.]